MPDECGRVVALGASNLTLGFQTVVATARAAWGPKVEVLAALGYGRSYGARSSVLARTLPGILQSGLWRQLESLPPVPTRALVTDVGNDILYGFSAKEILAWIEEVVERLQRVTHDIVLTSLPLAGIRRVSELRFLLIRSIIVPRCRLALPRVLEVADDVNEGLAALASRYGLTFFRLKPEWYGFDPIHIRPAFRRLAWPEILCGQSVASPCRRSRLEGLRLYFMAPERRWLLGKEQVNCQRGVALPSGGRVWLY